MQPFPLPPFPFFISLQQVLENRHSRHSSVSGHWLRRFWVYFPPPATSSRGELSLVLALLGKGGPTSTITECIGMSDFCANIFTSHSLKWLILNLLPQINRRNRWVQICQPRKNGQFELVSSFNAHKLEVVALFWHFNCLN